jgi:hypothetical protein
VDGATRDLEHVAGLQLPLLAVHARGERALEHLEALVLGGVEVLGRRRASGTPRAFDLDRPGVGAQHAHGFSGCQLERVGHLAPDK